MSVFNKLKRQDTHLDILLATETNRLKGDRLDAGLLLAESPATAEAWTLDGLQQARNKKTGRNTQFLSAVNYKPIQIYQDIPVRDIHPATILESNVNQQLSWTDDEKDTIGSKFFWIGIPTAVLVFVACLLAYLTWRGH